MSAIGCPVCGDPLDRIQPSWPIRDQRQAGRRPDLYAAYPCNHWLTASDAADVVVAYRVMAKGRAG